MPIAQDRFCINRKIAPTLNLAEFFQLVAKCGISKVELRNDMAGGKVTDNLSHQEVNTLASEYGIEIITINALGQFNQRQDRARLLQRTEALLEEAAALRCRALVLCPNCGGHDPRSVQEKEQDTLAALITLAPLFKRYGITGLVEPLGFHHSSLRSSLVSQAIIRDTGAPYKMVMDTFHHYLSELSFTDFNAHIQVDEIGLVHLSGVEDGRVREELSDEQRIMLSPRDRLESRSQVKNLERLGYRGLYSFEPFSSVLASWSKADIEREIRQSIALLQAE